MKVSIQKTESRLFNGNIIRVDEFEKAREVISSHDSLIKKYSPSFIYCVVEAGMGDTWCWDHKSPLKMPFRFGSEVK